MQKTIDQSYGATPRGGETGRLGKGPQPINQLDRFQPLEISGGQGVDSIELRSSPDHPLQEISHGYTFIAEKVRDDVSYRPGRAQ
nr:hypothetical protein [Brevibacterium senegalense]